MFKRIVLLIAALFVIPMALTGCGSEPNHTVKSSSTTQQEAPVSLNGNWTAENFTAEVQDHGITINLTLDDTTGVYWAGTFDTTDEAVQTVTSEGDQNVLNNSLFGSQDATKVFKIDGQEISFEFTIMGTTKTVRLKPVK